MKRNKSIVLSTLLIMSVFYSIIDPSSSALSDSKHNNVIVKASRNKVVTNATIISEDTSKRTRFTKTFRMSDGSFTVYAYSMPVHYKKNGSWKEINTALKSSGKMYATKAGAVKTKVAKLPRKKKVVSLKRGSYTISWAPVAKKYRDVDALFTNPKKSDVTKVRNYTKVKYKKGFDGITLTEEIYPEKLIETYSIPKKSLKTSYKIKINSGKLKVSKKGKRLYFKTKSGKEKFIRLAPVFTDAKGVATYKSQISYNKKKKILTIKPDKKWIKSKKRKFPVQMRMTIITSSHEREIHIGAAYSGVPDASYSYSKSLLLKYNSCDVFFKMDTLNQLKGDSVRIRDARIYIKNLKTISQGAGNAFDVGIHQVLSSWNGKKLSYSNRPKYDTDTISKLSISKKKTYSADITDLITAWHTGVGNYGLAMIADNTNGSYQAEIDKEPSIRINYEVMGFEGATKLEEDVPLTIDAISSNQENYVYFEPEPDVVYDIYTEGSCDTQATMYDETGERVDYDDDDGIDKNILFTGKYDGKRYLKISLRNGATGKYTINLKKHFGTVEPTGVAGADGYTVSWGNTKGAKEYLVEVYDSGRCISQSVVSTTSYTYVYTSSTAGKVLGFRVVPRMSEELVGLPSRMIFSRSTSSDWGYDMPMNLSIKNASAVSIDDKIYVLGGETGLGSTAGFYMYDTKSKKWTELENIPIAGNDGICLTALVTSGKQIYAIGGQTDTSSSAKLYSGCYMYDISSGKWIQKKSLSEGRTSLKAVYRKDKIYLFSRLGTSNRIDVYDVIKDSWTAMTHNDTQTIEAAVNIDDRIFVLRTDSKSLSFSEYLPDENEYEEAGAVCPYMAGEHISYVTAVNGVIYMTKDAVSSEVYAYDVYTDQWSRISDRNLMKRYSALVASGNILYDIGGELSGFGITDVVENYSIPVGSVLNSIEVKKDEIYELQVNVGDVGKVAKKTVSVSIDPAEMSYLHLSSYDRSDENSANNELNSTDGAVKVVRYEESKGLLVLEISAVSEEDGTFFGVHSIPMVAKKTGKVKVSMSVE